jgi:hypothetical protein
VSRKGATQPVEEGLHSEEKGLHSLKEMNYTVGKKEL